MFRFLIRLLLAILTLRVLVGLVRFAARIAARDPDARVGPGGGGGPEEPHERAPQPIVDRASAIDVPFTEEPRES
jgi:hypothetical protein